MPADRALLVAVAMLVPGLAAAQPAPAASAEDLYNTGVRHAEAAEVSAAIDAFSQLRRQFPTSHLAPRALARIAKLYASVAMYDKAAPLLEEYALTYAGERDAYAAMSDAVYYWRAIGEYDKAIWATKSFVKTFGTKRPADAANAYFSLTAIYEARGERDAVGTHLADYIRQYGAKGGRDKLVIAYAKLGESWLEASCPLTQIDGACARRKRTKRVPVCADALPVELEPVRRDAGSLKKAQQAFASAIKTYDRIVGTPDEDEVGARYYYARAKLALVDLEAEPLDATARDKLRAKYEALRLVDDAAVTITAASRIARLHDDVASALVRETSKPAGCDAARTAAAPAREHAKRAYSVCLAKAIELGWFDDAARSCEHALTRLAPEQFPPLRETIGRAAQIAPVLTLERL